MPNKIHLFSQRFFAFILVILLFISTLYSSNLAVYAADNTINFQSGPQIPYGDYVTTRMTFDGNNTAYCVEPMKKTPPVGTYSYSLLSKDSPLRKALYYLNGGYGYEKIVKDKYFSGWSDNDSYVIGHLVVAYIYAGYSENTGAFYGAPQNFITKAKEVASAIKELPDAPDSFRAFIVPGNGNQTLAGSWYQKPYGWIEIKKTSANPDLTTGNSNYSLEGAKYGIYQGDKLLDTLTTDKNGYAKSKALEDGSYTLKELEASTGYIVDTKSYNVTVTPEQTTTADVKEVPQNNPMDLLIQKLDKELSANAPQGSASLADAEFTVKFYTQLSDTDPADSGVEPVRIWIFKTNASGELKFSKEALVSGDDLYQTSDGSAFCLPFGTVTVQETKAPTGYTLNETIHVQKITGTSKTETISVYQSADVEEQIFRGGVKLQKRDFETKEAAAQGAGTLKNAEFTITSLNENPVLVDGKTYAKDEVVYTLTTDENGMASTSDDLLPYGHYRLDETKAPAGYLNEGVISREFDITENGKIVELTDAESAILNQPIRGDLELIKVSDGDLKRLANVPFKITSLTTGESHIIITDENGYASTSSTWNKHTTNTNQGKNPDDGVWFGSSSPDDSKGALLYDKYRIEEQSCDANQGMELLTLDIKVYKNNVTVNLGTMTDDVIPDIPEVIEETPSNDTPNSPSVSSPVKTGDDMPILLYVGIGGGALLLAVILAIIYYRKRKQK